MFVVNCSLLLEMLLWSVSDDFILFFNQMESCVNNSELNLCICLLVFVSEILWQIFEACLYCSLIGSVCFQKFLLS